MNIPVPAKTQAADILVVPPNAGEAWWVITNHQRIKLTSRDTGGALSLWMEVIPPGGGPPPHVHYGEDEIFIVTEGEITFASGERSWVGTTGTVVFAPRGVPHSFRNNGATNARMTILVTPGGFDEFFREVACRHPAEDSRPEVPAAEYEHLVRTAQKYDLVFQVPQAAAPVHA